MWDWLNEAWTKMSARTTELLGQYVPKVVAAIAILIIGWIAARLIAAIIRGGLRRTGLNKRLGRWLVSEPGDEVPQVEQKVAKGVFYVLMLLVLVAFFQALGLTLVTEPLNRFLNQVFEYAPRILGAALVLLVAWIVARVMRFVVAKALSATNVDRHLTRQAGVDERDTVPLTKTLSESAYWLTLLLFLPAVLGALGMPGLLAPVEDMVAEILAFLPNVVAAAIIFVVGWFVARIVQRIASNLLAAVGVDRLSDRVGVAKVLGQKKLSEVIGLVVYILILIPVIVAALNALQIEAITQPASQMLENILNAIPGIFAAVLIVAIAYVVGRVVAELATNLLASIGFNSLPVRLGLAKTEAPAGTRTPAEVAGYLLLLAIMLLAVMQALPMLGFDLAAEMMSQFLVFAGHILLGLLIFALGLYFARLAADVIAAANLTNGRLLAWISRAAILVLAAAMALRQMGLANEIVVIAFGSILGAIAVAAAIAFGIGGRDAAKKAIDSVVSSKGLGGKP